MAAADAGGQRGGGQGANLADRFLAVASRTPDREAVIVDGEEPTRLTYAALTGRVERLAAALHSRGVGPHDRVGVHLANGNEHLEVLLASFLLRAVPVNLSYRDGPDEVRTVIASSGATFVVHEPDLEPVAPVSLARGSAYEAALAEAGAPPRVDGRSGDDEYLLYTGGTTSRPKGVVWTHEDLFRGALAAAGDDAAAARGVRSLIASPIAHGTGQWMALTTLLHGGTVVVRRDRSLDPEALLDAVDREAVSFLVVVGDAFARPLVDTLGARPGRWSLSSLTTLLSGGAVLSPATKAALLHLLPTVLVVDGFGASETGGQGRMVSVAGVIPGGPPRFVVDEATAVLDDDLQPIPAGDLRVGWLARRGTIPRGYDANPPETAAAFPVVDGVRWAMPGDRARHEADGTVTVIGRGSTTISTGGHRVQPEEVEECLRAHPSVTDVVVVGVPDDRFGERVAAIVAARGDDRLTLESIQRHCERALAGYKVPRRLVLVDRVLRTTAGKTDYDWALRVATA